MAAPGRVDEVTLTVQFAHLPAALVSHASAWFILGL
jgi:hypothetical protein